MQPYNYKMANKGMNLEQLINYSNQQYKKLGLSNIQKISTPWTVIRKGKEIISAFPNGQSTLDFRGTAKGGMSISFDCKESQDERGLPLAYIKEHQVEFIDNALKLSETSFIICEIKPSQKVFFIPGKVVFEYYNAWQENKGKKGYNLIPTVSMVEIKKSKRAIACDYLALLGI
ncbi:MAG: Holliday junction resolvase RecU [Oscillospiraceae bacterium]